MDKLFKGGKGFEKGKEQIAEGEKQVAKGEGRVNTGEKRLAAGEQVLLEGQEQLRFARAIRVACAFAAVFFTLLSIVFGLCWRRRLARIFKHTITQ
jgi:hypothetical protein